MGLCEDEMHVKQLVQGLAHNQHAVNMAIIN